MILSVIVPDKRPGMQRMLDNELKDIDSEVIYSKWKTGLKRAKGDFVLLLEHDSAISKGSITHQLSPFLDNPRFRKLAMVSPMVEFEDEMNPRDISRAVQDKREDYSLVRAGSVIGAIVRRNSLEKYCEKMPKNIIEFGFQLSFLFWENGLRVMIDPQATYYTPNNYVARHKPYDTWDASEDVKMVWHRECIA